MEKNGGTQKGEIERDEEERRAMKGERVITLSGSQH